MMITRQKNLITPKDVPSTSFQLVQSIFFIEFLLSFWMSRSYKHQERFNFIKGAPFSLLI